MAITTINLSDTVANLVTKTNTVSSELGDIDASSITGSNLVTVVNTLESRISSSTQFEFSPATSSYEIVDGAITYQKLNTGTNPGDGEVLSYNASNGRLEWVEPSLSGDQIVNIATSTPSISGGTVASDSATITIPANVIAWELEIYDDSVTSVAGAGSTLVIDAPISNIANTAVTTRKLADGAVTTVKTSFIDSDNIEVPFGNTAARPSVPATGSFRFNTQDSNLEVYNGDSWQSANPPKDFTTTINLGDWADSSPHVATKTVAGILGTDAPFFSLDVSGYSFDSITDASNEWALVYLAEASANNQVKFYATDSPDIPFDVIIKVIR